MSCNLSGNGNIVNPLDITGINITGLNFSAYDQPTFTTSWTLYTENDIFDMEHFMALNPDVKKVMNFIISLQGSEKVNNIAKNTMIKYKILK